jgi:hypothetical protein
VSNGTKQHRQVGGQTDAILRPTHCRSGECPTIFNSDGREADRIVAILWLTDSCSVECPMIFNCDSREADRTARRLRPTRTAKTRAPNDQVGHQISQGLKKTFSGPVFHSFSFSSACRHFFVRHARSSSHSFSPIVYCFCATYSLYSRSWKLQSFCLRGALGPIPSKANLDFWFF